jgi:hypothetical protein
MFNFCSEIDALAAAGGDEPVRAVLTDVCALFALIHIHEVLGCRGPRHAPRAFAAARSSTRSNVPSTRLFRAVWHAKPPFACFSETGGCGFRAQPEAARGGRRRDARPSRSGEPLRSSELVFLRMLPSAGTGVMKP